MQRDRTPARRSSPWLRVCLCFTFVAAGLLLAVLGLAGPEPWHDFGRSGAFVRLNGSVSPALEHATKRSKARQTNESLVLTVVLNRADEAGFEKFLDAVRDPRSAQYQHYLTQSELAERFGPSRSSYETVETWLRDEGFTIVEGSTNRLTITMRGTRAQIEKSFRVGLDEYELAGRTFYANNTDPAVPASLAREVQAIVGLTNLAQPVRAHSTISTGPINRFGAGLPLSCWVAQRSLDFFAGEGLIIGGLSGYQCMGDILNLLNLLASGGYPPVPANAANSANSAPQPAAAGAGQKIGLVQFDNFHLSDVQNFLQLMGREAQFNQLSQVHVAGGAGAPGADESEVLLDIAAVMSLAPGAQVIVYDAPFQGRGSFQTVFNAMINDGVNIISNSWAYCEDQTTSSDVHSIDSILANAAAAGITVVTGAGDQGSTCLDGTPNVAHVPANVPHITAVGGTTAKFNIGGTYGSETWWNSNPSPGGAGGFGVSRFFPRPSYQDGLTTNPMRTIPDVTAPADPATGFFICQDSAGGCPTNLIYGGTSVAAPVWAAFVAVLNQRENTHLGFLNPKIYPLANTNAFHSATEMGSDFTHVGLGSPNVGLLDVALSGATLGGIDAAKSRLDAFPSTVVADGSSKAGIVVTVADSQYHSLSGKNVMVTMNAGSHAIVTPLNSVTNVSNGAALFTVTDTQLETVTFSATVDGIPLSQQPAVKFVSAPAAAGGITATPNTVTANGSDATTITVTLQDAKGQPSPGKVVNLSQGNGASIISGTTATTDATGKVQFTAVDYNAETVTYTAVDVTDSNLPVPGSATVSFVNSTGCTRDIGIAASGYSVTSFATGFPRDCFSGVSPIGVSFDANGNLFVGSFVNDTIYSFGPQGGIAGPATQVGRVLYPSNGGLTGLTFAKDGRLYAGLRYGSNVFEVNPTTGAVIRVVATMPDSAEDLHVDPLSGDLFASTYGAIYRISNFTNGPGTVTTYLLGGAIDGFTFAPDGTLYFKANGDSAVYRANGTNTPNPGTFVQIAYVGGGADGVALEPNPANPSKPFIYVNRNDGTITRIDLSAAPPNVFNCADAGAPCTDIYTGGSRGDFVTVGPDGCLFATQSDRVIKITKADGSCSLTPTNLGPQLVLTPVSVTPSPAQGTSVTLTASLDNVANAAGVPVIFNITGANSFTGLVNTDANGQAAFSYTGTFSGMDQITATATAGGNNLKSNQSTVAWTAGKHVTSLTLNSSPGGGAPNAPLKMVASLLDASVKPAAAIPNAVVAFSVAGQQCNGMTDVNGVASCTVTPSIGAGSYNLQADFSATGNFVGSSASKRVDLFDTPPHQLLNISTRGRVDTGDNVMIGGFIITGTQPKHVLVRGIGPSLSAFGVQGVLADPTLGLFSGQTQIDSNDNWRSNEAAVIATGFAPGDDRESAIVKTLDPGAYTAILSGKNGTTGVALVEVYDVDSATAVKLTNISTRGLVENGDNVMIGGFIAGPTDGTLVTVLVRALGPSLSAFGVSNVLTDPTITIYDVNGNVLRSNDDWKTDENGQSQQSDIEATGFAPGDARESAIVMSLAPGNYTGIVRGKNGTTGVSLVELYSIR